jgi:hypothetical protein
MDNTATARLISGYTEFDSNDLVDMSVASIRSRFGATFNIPSGARANINGIEASETAIVKAGDDIVFDAPTGSKG